MACNPIVDWTDDDVWSYIRNNGIECNPLYEEGFGRIGCVGCPLAGRAKMLRDFERWPKYEKLYRRATEKLYQKLKAEGRDFVLTKKPEVVYANNSDEMFEWWLHVRK